MTPKSPAQKLGLMPAGALRLFAAPPGAAALLGALPEGAQIIESGKSLCPLVLMFARGSSELVRILPQARAALAPGGAVWVAFYKGSSQHKTDIDREIIREHAMTLGLDTVGIISIDADWSALRFKSV